MGAEAALHAESVDLLPLGTLAAGIATAIAARLSRHLHLPCRVLPACEPSAPQVPGRDQLDANALLADLESRQAGERRVLVGVTAEDVAVPIFTFVFGLARKGGGACLVSIARTDPSFYGLPRDQELRDGRAVAEILHELGHLAGLDHCRDRGCLMSFAGNVEKVDTRGSRFCAGCAGRLPSWLRGPAPAPEPV